MVKAGFYLRRDKKASAASAEMVLLRRPFHFQRGGTLARSGTFDRENFQMEHAIFEIFGTSKFLEIFPGN